MELKIAHTTKKQYVEMSEFQIGDSFDLGAITNLGVSATEEHIVIAWEVHEELISGKAEILLHVQNIRTGEDIYILPEKGEKE
jgi:hypothetical protein